MYFDNNFLEGNSIKSQNDSIIFSQPDANRRKVYTNVEKIEKNKLLCIFSCDFFSSKLLFVIKNHKVTKSGRVINIINGNNEHR